MPRQSPIYFEAIDSFNVGGVTIHAGETFGAGHPMLKGKRHLFRRFEPTHPWNKDEPKVEAAVASPPVETATAAPGEKRGSE